jgi:hypothetical protein
MKRTIGPKLRVSRETLKRLTPDVLGRVVGRESSVDPDVCTSSAYGNLCFTLEKSNCRQCDSDPACRTDGTCNTDTCG